MLAIAQPDRTLAELREALPTCASLATIWRALARRRFARAAVRLSHRYIVMKNALVLGD